MIFYDNKNFNYFQKSISEYSLNILINRKIQSPSVKVKYSVLLEIGIKMN